MIYYLMGQGGVKVPHGIEVAHQLKTGKASWLIWMDPQGSIKVEEEGRRIQREKDSTYRAGFGGGARGLRPRSKVAPGRWKRQENRFPRAGLTSSGFLDPVKDFG